jgi:hypothetical protein
MPFVFIIIGVGFVVIAIRGTQATAFQLLQSEFSGPNSFIKWALAIFILGAVGYIPTIRPVTRALLALVLLVIFLVNGKGLFAQFNNQIANPTAPPPQPSTAGNTTSSGSGLNLGQNTGGGLNLGQGASGGLNLGQGAGSGLNLGQGASGGLNLGQGAGGGNRNISNVYDQNGNWVGVGNTTTPEFLGAGQYFGE